MNPKTLQLENVQIKLCSFPFEVDLALNARCSKISRENSLIIYNLGTRDILYIVMGAFE